MKPASWWTEPIPPNEQSLPWTNAGGIAAAKALSEFIFRVLQEATWETKALQ
jgi:hypothetical protein